MAAFPVHRQWYQTEATVTASFKLCPSHVRGEVTADFRENYCAVYDGGELYWEVWLADLVVPTKCKLVIRSARAEVRLTKAGRRRWEDFEVAAPVNGGVVAESVQDRESWIRSSPLASITNTYVPEDLMFVQHVYHDFYDVQDWLRVKVQVGGVLKSSCKVSFSETTMEAKFQTRNAKFLRMYEDHSRNTFFVWKIKLYGKIDPSKSYWKVHTNCIEILLNKLSTKRWKTLSAPHIRPRASPDSTREPLDSVAATENREELAGSNWNDLNVGVPVDFASKPHSILTNGLSRDSYSPSRSIDDTPTQMVVSPPRNLGTRITAPDTVSSNHSGSSSTSGYSSNASDTGESDRRCVGYASNTSNASDAGESSGCTVTTERQGGMNNVDIDTPYDPSDPDDLGDFSNSRQPSSPASAANYTDRPSNSTKVGPSNLGTAGLGIYRDHPSTADNEVTSDCRVHPSTADNEVTSDCRVHPSSAATVSNDMEHGSPPQSFEVTRTSNDASIGNHGLSNKDTTAAGDWHAQFSTPNFTGLSNIGNSCFMNSVVQCLSNTESLRHYFTSGQFREDINKGNPLGFKGQLADCFFDVIRELWSGEYEYCSLKRLKFIVASRSGNFGGYQQQDSHEFMSYLLDGLHEDLNRVRDKPVTFLPEGCGLADSVLAEKAWQVHRERNDSFFVDNFQGQFKSTLVCPVCQNVSVTFDPFMSLSVPISRNLRHLPIFFVAQDPSKVPRRFVLKLPPDANLELLKASVARKIGISMLQLRMFEIFNNRFHNLLSSNQQPIASIGEKDVIIVSEVASGRGGREEVVEINMIQRVKVPLFPIKCTSCGCHSDADKKLLRCGKCKAVGYCNRSCQGHDWAEHKMKCRSGRPTPLGLPFVVSMTAREFTYSRLASMAELFARRSVEVVIQPTAPPDLENTDSIQSENTEGGEKNSEGVLLPDKKPIAYSFVPVDRYGDNKESTGSLQDLGDTPLPFRGQYLAMDWQNNSKEPGAVQVHPKPVLEHELDPAVSMEMNSQSCPSSNAVSLDQCIELFTQPETLSKEEAWYCSKCKEHREATKQISIWKLPPILIIHLKRFSYSGNSHRDKLKDRVEFPLRDLDLTPFMLGEATSFRAEALPIYDLYATVNHCGAVYMGHYIAQVKPPSERGKGWLLYDDASVKTIQEREVVDSTAYLLFYKCRAE